MSLFELGPINLLVFYQEEVRFSLKDNTLQLRYQPLVIAAPLTSCSANPM